MAININPILGYSNTIIGENHNIADPKVATKHQITNAAYLQYLSVQLGMYKEINAVIFSSPNGAEEHIDTHLAHLDTMTSIIPVVLPPKGAVLYYDNQTFDLAVGEPVKINHQLPHRVTVGDESGCVLIMASEVL